MDRHVALYTFGIFMRPSEDQANDDFHSLNDQILPLVDKAPGMVARSGYDFEPGPDSWGTQIFPKFYKEKGDGWSPSTLSLWVDMESAMAFSYFGLHALALKRGKEWMERPKWPPYILWWPAEGHRPDWTDAVARHQHMHDHGPSPRAFDFKNAFDLTGEPVDVDHGKVKAIAARQQPSGTM
ncbi:MAG: DUF3291 domain-containing protein [Stappiaceae bacterium]